MFALLVYLSLFLVLCPGLGRIFAAKPARFSLVRIVFKALRAVRSNFEVRALVVLVLTYIALSPRVTPWPYEHFLFQGREIYTRDDASLTESMRSPIFAQTKLLDETWQTPHGALHVVRLVNDQGNIDAVVLVSQGIAGNIAGHEPLLELLAQTGVREIVIYEPRGFGRSHFANWSTARIPTYFGSLEHVSCDSMLEDGREVLAILRQKEAGRGRPIIWWGESFGASVVSYLSTHEQSGVAGIVLQSGFQSIADVAYDKHDMKFNPCHYFPRLLFPRQLNTAAWLKGNHPPALIIHGVKDPIVPYQHSMEVARSASAPCRLVTLPTAGHVQMTSADQIIALKAVTKFMEGLTCQR